MPIAAVTKDLIQNSPPGIIDETTNHLQEEIKKIDDQKKEDIIIQRL